MKKFGKFIAKNRILVIIISVLLLIPSLLGIIKTDVNYDLLSYLPQELDSMKGQKILDNDFKDAAISMLIIENMESKDVAKIKDKISNIKGVEDVIWVNDLLDISVPKEILPDELKNTFYSKDTTLLFIKFSSPSASRDTMDAIGNIKKVLNRQCFLSGMAAIIKDTKDLADKEAPLYIILAVIFATIVMMITMESTIVPFIFLIGIFFAVMFNMGTNIIFGQISYVTKLIAGVLQLAVTMDYSIFLLHRYEEEKEKYEDKNDAMASAIASTFTAITGSSLTTVAGFLALCFMQLRIGMDIGLVMAKGVVIGVISVVTILPALLLIFDKYISTYTHKTILPQFAKTANFVTNKYKVLIVLFIALFIPAIYGQSKTEVYYNLDESLPKTLDSIAATSKLKADYDMATTHMIIINKDIPWFKVNEMIGKIEKIDGINKVLSYDKYVGPSIPESFIPEEIKNFVQQSGYKLIIANSKYKAATDEENAQIDKINKIVKSYDSNGMIAGEGPLTKDLIEIADKDFKSSNFFSIVAVFGIILFVFSSISIPVLLVLAIELAIFINMAVPFYTNTTIPFIASIVIGSIQLGATVDYAILLTTRFKEELQNGYDKFKAMEIAVKGSAKSIITSALVFFGSTAGVGFISKIEMIKSLCSMMARGSIISMIVIIFILPSILLVCEKLISATSRNWNSVSKIRFNTTGR